VAVVHWDFNHISTHCNMHHMPITCPCQVKGGDVGTFGDNLHPLIMVRFAIGLIRVRVRASMGGEKGATRVPYILKYFALQPGGSRF